MTVILWLSTRPLLGPVPGFQYDLRLLPRHVSMFLVVKSVFLKSGDSIRNRMGVLEAADQGIRTFHPIVL